jgi:beta-fructofuranosidase
LLHLPSSWTWDFWLADDGERYHLYYLKAPRALIDPNRRHWRATIGHATSPDLVTWTETVDALLPSDGPGWDDLATWTGSVVRDDDGLWRMFYTGVDRASRGLVQRIGCVTSDDLYTWRRPTPVPLLEADPRWYEKLSDAAWPDEAWRDPWIMRDADTGEWHMLITARARAGDPDQRGVIGHARSHDLSSWTAQPPLTRPGQGFGQLEVPQVHLIDGKHVLIFSCLGAELSDARRARHEPGGVWLAEAATPLGPFEISTALPLTDEQNYAGRLVQDRNGLWQLMTFHNLDRNGTFIGELADPAPFEPPHTRLTAPMSSPPSNATSRTARHTV